MTRAERLTIFSGVIQDISDYPEQLDKIYDKFSERGGLQEAGLMLMKLAEEMFCEDVFEHLQSEGGPECNGCQYKLAYKDDAMGRVSECTASRQEQCPGIWE